MSSQPAEKRSLFKRLRFSERKRSVEKSSSTQSASSPLATNTAPTGLARLCARCDNFIVHYLSADRHGPSSLSFRHGTRAERHKTAMAGCPACSLSLRAADGDEDYRFIESTNRQATITWTNTFELYEPGAFASVDKRPLEEDARNGYHPAEFENVYQLQKDAPPRTDDPACFELICMWIQSCSLVHPNCSRPVAQASLPTRVIDVGSGGSSHGDPFLFESGGNAGGYVTLSHRWEPNLSFKTTLASLEEHKQSLPLSALPATFRDAVIVCRKVGIQYLWIDAICIIQDSSEDWDREAMCMASIYNNAVFTISALDSGSSQGGLFRQRVATPHVTFSSPLTGNSSWPSVMGMRVAASAFNKEMEKSPLSSRGWVYQERVLSTATLHYGAHQMIWECRNKVVSEFSSGIQVFTQGLTYDFGRSMTVSREEPKMLMEEWDDVVGAFSRKRFTVPTDRLPAIMGVMQLFEDRIDNHSNNVFIAGLWTGALHKQLLWVYDDKDEHDMVGPPSLDLVWVPPGWKPRSPSWSWISVDYPVRPFVPVDADALEWNFGSLDIDVDLLTDLSRYRVDPSSLELRLVGRIMQFSTPAKRLSRQKPTAASLRFGSPPLEMHAVVDPGCDIPEEFVGFRICTYRGGTIPLPPQSYFLLLQPVPFGSLRFRRIGIGRAEPVVASLMFQDGEDVELALI